MASFIQFDPSKLKTLLPDQERAIELIRDSIKSGHKHIVVQAPCNYGKTVLITHLAAGSLEKGNNLLLVNPRKTLVEQGVRRFTEEGIFDIGVMQAQHELTNSYASIQIASEQTLRRRGVPSGTSYIVIDEGHIRSEYMHSLIKSEAWKDKIVITFTATPWAKGMGLVYDDLIIVATIKDMIHAGRSADPIVYVPDKEHSADFSRLKIKSDEEFTAHSAESVMSDKKIVGDIVKTWIDNGPGYGTFMFAVNCAHAQLLQKEFQDSGVQCGYIDAKTDNDDRKIVFEKFRSREYKIICSVGCLSLGVDECVICIIDAQPKRSEMSLVQEWGRIRVQEGISEYKIFDHAGNAYRIGLPKDINHAHLDTHDPSDKGKTAYDGEAVPSKPRRCSKCGALIPAGKRFCLACGFQVPPSSSDIENVPGELVVYGSKPKKKEPKPDIQTKKEWFSGLLWIQNNKNYKSTWAAHTYKERFGCWPHNSFENTTKPEYPSLEVRNWNRRRAAEWYESKKREQVSA